MANRVQVSLPSKKISTVDVAEIEQFRTSFVYNFFQKDERSNETGESVPNRYRAINTTDLPTDIQSNIDLNTRVPRYVNLTWQPFVVGNRVDIAREVKIRSNIDKVYFENSFSYDDYSVLEIQDLSVDSKLNLFVETLLKNTDQSNPKQSSTEALARSTRTTSERIRPELLANGLSPRLYGLRFFNQDDQEIESEDYSKLLKNYKSNIQINNKVIFDVINYNSYNDPTNPFGDELLGFIPDARRIQTDARKFKDSTRISREEYDFEIDNFVTQNVLFSEVHTPFIQTIGYIIEKYELAEDGQEIKKQNIFVENPNRGVYADFKVKYGATYLYRIRTVFYIEIEGIDEVSTLISSLGILVASRTTTSSITCVENTPPTPPQDIIFKFNPNENTLKISWNLPVNTQRDIKRFQVFRRYSMLEPYELLKEYNFDDSELKVSSGEFVEPYLVELLSGPKTIYYDYEFTKDTVAYYALTSIDAHGISSNYSSQFRVRYNKIQNRLIVDLFSTSGAPKAYPNMYINQDTFVDSLRDQYHSKMHVYFNPEYLKVFNKDDKDLNLLAIKAEDCYQIQLVNIDVNEQQLLKIKLEDRTENVIREPVDGAINRTLLKQKLNTERLKNINADTDRQESGYITKRIESIFKNQ
jgi:hypothetical protein